MFRLLPIFFLLACDDVVSNDIQQIPNEELPYFNISMLNERNYPMSVDGSVYSITISSNYQSIFKMKGITGSSRTERITWTTNNNYRWSNGIVEDYYPLVNPASYTKDGVGYSMVGFLPEMKGTSVIIYGHYHSITDSIIVNIK